MGLGALGALFLAACAETRDLGTTVPRGKLPVDARNPILLMNDGSSDNWQGEYALLLAHGHSLGIWYLATERFGPVTDVGVHVWMAAPIWRG